jgi:flavin reductase (DIM6/NTAB) family NADH-FMN oxidoreductase RutF
VKKNLGSVLGLYPTPVTVVGAIASDKPNWLLVAHVGIIGHDKILISVAKAHFTNKLIKESGKVSVNLVDEALLPKADYVGCVSGSKEDKSGVFKYEIGEAGAPIITESPLVMECSVVDIYDTDTFDNFILKIDNTYAEEKVVGEDGKLNYEDLKPVLFEMPTYKYIKTGEVLGNCMKLAK